MAFRRDWPPLAALGVIGGWFDDPRPRGFPPSSRAAARDPLGSGDDLVYGRAVVDLEALATRHFELARVEAELVQDGGVDVGDVVAVFDGVEADLVGGAVGDAALDPAAGHP